MQSLASLREKAKTIDAILTEPEFRNLHPDDVTMAVISSSDPRAHLREKNTGSWQSQVIAKREESATPMRQLYRGGGLPMLWLVNCYLAHNSMGFPGFPSC